jgi:type IV secretory pathway VirJ component
VVHLTSYLLALDEQYDWQASELREGLRCAEEAEIFFRMLEVQLAEAHANLAAAESREATMAEAVKVDQDRHAQEKEDWCCCTASTSAHGSLRDGAFPSPHPATTKRRSGSVAQCSRRAPRA